MTTILVVDDLADMRHALRRQFVRHVEVFMAANVEEALAILGRVEVTTILTDYRMPGGDGVGLLREVRRRWPAIRRFLTSGEDVPDIAALIADGLVERFLPKPMDVAGIVALLTTAPPG